MPPGLEGLQPGVGIDGGLEDLLGRPGGHHFDLDAALGAGHQHRHADGPVQDHADVEFLLDVGGLLHQELGDFLSFRPGLHGDQRVLEHDLGDGADLVAFGQVLDAAELFGDSP